ncbi:NAD(P)-dependent glycerol-3-phosphate dehydrogenase [Thermomonas brevis]|uniref:Glycerol-3-phosphate dehydrogenase [NAD(P)+] n=1 Tax=Thermomonas brevis TaxID=215691 RepID=A0A7G9QQ89_9GAMM|nr:NAD(P)H-dependent glycerol-3-phosphate dehydrogenase [Thermomonas brevis]QNN45514.1 NAD(P)-dependent glycerol-3-phosphate dehydrogenase [Thermomonas brevis]
MTASDKPKVAVLGAGSWGTALAALIARHGHPTVLWGRDPAMVAAIDGGHENTRYLPGIALPGGLRATTSLPEALADAGLVLVVVPSHAFAETLRALAPLRPAHAGVAWATKGFEPGSGRFLHEVAAEVLGEGVPLAVVTGPSFAKEVAEGLPTALTVHSDDAEFCRQVADALHGPAFRAYTGNDMRGAELGGAMKNVLAVATGVADGMALGLNARAGLITRGLNEMLRLNIALGGRPETLMGLAGLGDLVLTCTGDLSRNRRLGLALGRGSSIKDAVREIGQVVESIQTADEVMRLAGIHGIELPIAENVRDVLHGDITPAEGLARLMARERKAEYPQSLFG